MTCLDDMMSVKKSNCSDCDANVSAQPRKISWRHAPPTDFSRLKANNVIVHVYSTPIHDQWQMQK